MENPYISRKEAVDIINSIRKVNVGVVGDVMLDRYIFGRVKRISPEAPVPVVEVTKEKVLCGGAANVCANISSLGANVKIASITGDDKSAKLLREILDSMNGVSADLMIEDAGCITTEKTRVIAEHQQVVRVDKEQKLIYSKSLKLKFKDKIRKIVSDSDVIILSDYGKGVLSKDIIEYTVELSRRKKIPVFVDPKIEHFPLYKKVTSMTPNVSEAFGGMRRMENRDVKEIEKIGREILKKLSLPTLIITRSEDGMSVFERSNSSVKITHIPTAAKEVFDVTGAGDTVISVVSVCYAVCRDILKSAIIANYAAGIVVSKIGAATVTPDELMEVLG